MKDFSYEESERLIEKPFSKLNIKIEQNAKIKLISQTNGHPQMLQQECYELVEFAVKKKGDILEEDVDAVVNILFRRNTALDILKHELDKNKERRELINEIITGAKKKYYPHKELSIEGAGCIVEDEDSHCTIRNKIYEKFLSGYFDIHTDIISSEDLKKKKRYNLIEEIGKGGMGIVYKGRDTLLNRTVAIKKLNREFTGVKNSPDKFLIEAQITAQLRHPNIVTVYNIEQINRDYLIIMEFIEGPDYNKIIEHNKPNPLPLEEVLFVGKHLFTALDFSHKKGIIHLDIKPQNIMKHRDGVKIVDFGIAAFGKNYHDDESKYIIATPYYLSPEQIQGQDVDHRSDIYSAGTTLYHLATGEIPFKGKDLEETLEKLLNEPATYAKKLRSEIPVELAEVIVKCMQKNKKDRFQEAEEVLKQIEEIDKMLKNPDVEEIEDITSKILKKGEPPSKQLEKNSMIKERRDKQ